MAYDNFQNEPNLPVNGSSKRTSSDHLPKIYRTPKNNKFLHATLDRLISPGLIDRVNGYVGRRDAKAYVSSDTYVNDVTPQRNNYKFEPAAVIKNNLDDTVFYKDFNDYTNALSNFNSATEDYSELTAQEFYAWNPHIDWDKFSNFREYYWLPNGPQAISIAGNSVEVDSTYTVRLSDNLDSYSYIFTPDGLTPNPTLTLYRGVKYRFDVDVPNFPIVFRTKLTDQSEFDLDSSTILLYEGVDIQGLEQGTVTLELSQSAPDDLWYVSTEDINIHGRIQVKNIEEAAFIDVESEVLQKKNYTSGNGVAFSNGMKIKFIGQVEPEFYQNKTFYVEGVGEAIKLVEENHLLVPSEYTKEVDIEFDNIEFDSLPFDKALGYPLEKDYFTINRSAMNGNLWSRHNRWFHREIIELSAKLTNSDLELDQNFRASRPIIEFDPNLKLYNYGTKAKENIDLIDDFTKDVFSTIEGSIGYNVDNVELADGMRVLFLADTDPLVTNKIYQVKFITYDGTLENDAVVSNVRQITLVETDDTDPLENETVAVRRGLEYAGKVLSYSNNNWTVSQRKTTVNQSPLFDLFDSNGNSFSDEVEYPSSTFIGNKILSYKTGTGVNDSELGFPLSYQNINNVGDIVFESNYGQDTFSYVIDDNVQDQNTNKGYIYRYKNRTEYSVETQWKKVTDYKQPVVRQVVYDNTFVNVYLDVYENSSDFIDEINTVIFKNNNLLIKDTDYSIVEDPSKYAKINFVQDLKEGDVLVIKTQSSLPKNQNGKYEFPYSLERNPGNENLDTFTLGEVNDHVFSIVENTKDFIGLYPGVGNLRDLSNIDKNGRRFLQHSVPLNLSLYHITDDNANFVKSIRFAKNEYAKFKREFINISETLGFSGETKIHVDKILEEFARNKNNSNPFYFSDMIAYSGNIQTEHEIEDSDEIYFPLADNFTLDEMSAKAVYVYLNDMQLVHGKDYTFNTEGYAVVTADKNPQDIITIYEYENTNASYVPPTPSKLGLYPLYEPKKYLDTTLQTPVYMIQGHDGSLIKAYDDYRDDLLLELEKRIFNNVKVQYDSKVFDINKILPGYFRSNSIKKSVLNKAFVAEFLEWSALVSNDYHSHDFFARDNSFTYNFSNSTDLKYEKLPGYWREIYKYYYDTDRPNIAPWEMLGFTIEPKWWQDTYGEAPYTKDNFLLWEDIEKGIVRQPNTRPIYLNEYKRPGLLGILPVDEHGDLISPIEIGLLGYYDFVEIEKPFVFGDGAPVEAAWRRSSEFAFSLLIAYGLNKPNEFFATAYDRNNQVRDVAGNVVYKPTGSRFKLEDIIFPPNNIDDVYNFTSGIVNYIANYNKMIPETYSKYKSDLVSITNQVGFKFAGFTEKSKLKLILDSRTPLNKGNVFVPDEDYEIIYNESTPVDLLTYSAVIIERKEEGFLIKGYSKSKGYFNIIPHYESSADYAINVGGVSEPYVLWKSGQYYTVGTVVKNNNTFYRCKVANRDLEFKTEFFEKLPKLPIVGGKNAIIRKGFKQSVTEIPYGTLLLKEQDVVDFLLGYSEYLQSKGFVFEYYKDTENVVYDWVHSVREFLFWTLFRLDEGSVISLSPSANYLELKSEYSVVGDINNGPNDYTLLNANSEALISDASSLGRNDNNFFLYINDEETGQGIYHLELPLIQKEHVIVLNNQTVFNDTIYDTIPGYRQERIKIIGYRTDEWNGSANIPGFFYQDSTYTQWDANQSYQIGDLVNYDQSFYVANTEVPGLEFFDASYWTELQEKPRQGLYPNFEYKVNQFADFYDLDSDNFDTDQQKFAQHLIGYQKREYLENIINDDVSQYKFYQGMILEKGTPNAFSKLFDALASDEKDSLEFYEEWAIRDGLYGNSDTFDEFEVKLDESKFVVNPQLIQISDSDPIDNTTYTIPNYEVYLPTKDDTAPFPAKTQLTSFVKDSGYVHKDDVKQQLYKLEEIIGNPTNVLGKNEYLWIFGKDNEDWGVYRHTESDLQIKSIDFNIFTKVTTQNVGLNTELLAGVISREDFDAEFERYFRIQRRIDEENNRGFLETDRTGAPVEQVISELGLEKFDAETTSFYSTQITFKQPVTDIEVGDIIGINNVYITGKTEGEVLADSSVTLTNTQHDPSVNYFGQVTKKDNDSLEIKFTQELPIGNDIKASITKLVKTRFTSVSDANNALQKTFEDNISVWLDNYGNDKNWAVLDNNNQFELFEKFQGPKFTETPYSSTYGYSLAANNNNNLLAVGDPGNGDGKVWVYSRKSLSSNWVINDVIEPDTNIANNMQFGSSVDTFGPYIIIGSPTASNVKTKYKDNFSTSATYSRDDIVNYKDRLWQAQFSLVPALDGNSFNTFDSVANNIIPLDDNSQASIPIFIVGNYALRTNTDRIAFTDPVNHILVRAPKLLYNNTRSAEEYQVKFNWNTISKAYQDQDPLVSTVPFNNEYAGIDDTFFNSQHVIRKSVDVTLYFVSITNAPQEGDLVQSATGSGKVEYVASNDEDKYIVYLGNVVGTFNSAGSLFFSQTGEFIGDFEKQLDSVSDAYGGFWYIETPTYTVNTSSTFTDEGRGLVYVDISDDSTSSNLYYNIYDYNNTSVDSENNLNSYVKVFSNEGFPNADDENGEILDTRFAVRVPKDFSDTVSINDEVNLFANQLPNYTNGVTNSTAEIGLSLSQFNKAHKIVDIWDGYINIEFTKFTVLGEPYQPKIGQTIRDKNTNATAIVKFVERNGINVKLFVKNTTGLWSKGANFADSAAIEFLAIPDDPSPVYQIDREIGVVNSVSLGQDTLNIGKLLIFENTVSFTVGVFEIPYTGQNELIGAEYWVYTDREITGSPIINEAPSVVNNFWQEVFNIPADVNGTASDFINEGMYSVYKILGQGFELLGHYTVTDRQSNRHLGSNVKIRRNNDLYKAFVGAKGNEDTILPGKIYFVNNGSADSETYNWEFSKFKKYKGAFDETLNYRTGDVIYLDDPNGSLYTAKTNLVPKPFDINDWIENSEFIDYVGFIPNNTGTVVINDSVDYSTILNQELLETFGSSFDVSDNGEVLVARVTYLDKPSAVVVYRNIDGLYQLSQTIGTGDDSTNIVDSTVSSFATKVAISGNGMFIAVNEPLNDTVRANEGRVLIYKQINGIFELIDTLENTNYLKNEQFATEIDFDGERLAVYAKNADSIIDTTYDNNSTTFDLGFTNFAYANLNQGIVYVYDNLDGEFLLSQKLMATDNVIPDFGKRMVLKKNNIYFSNAVKVVDEDENNSVGEIYNFKLTDPINNSMWSTKRSLQDAVDVNKIKKVFLYNTRTNSIIKYLDYIDPQQGKIAGIAEQEISFKTPDDPAVYNVKIIAALKKQDKDIIFDTGIPWGPEHVGKVWWDIKETSFYNSYQNDLVYNAQTWNKLLPDSTVTVYEWIESTLLPLDHDVAVSERRIASGISKYGNNAYVTKQKYDPVSRSFVARYYFWVRRSSTVPNLEGRNLNITDIEKIISNPVSAGIEFVSFINGNTFLLNNVQQYLTSDDIVLSVQTYNTGGENNKIHIQYEITTENLETSQPNDDVILKWFDSLIGYDDYQRPVPDPAIPNKYKYGNLFTPRQSWFVNRNEALKQVVERINFVLKDNLIVDDKDLSPLLDKDPAPTVDTNEYDQIVDIYDDLADIKTDKLKRARISLSIENGKIVRTTIVDQGRGYKRAPTITVAGQGFGAVLSTTIDSIGKVTSVVIEEPGENYNKDTIAVVRGYRVLVNNDIKVSNKWSIYERDTVVNEWSRIVTQKYDTTLYWDYADWYAEGLNSNVEINHIIKNTHELYTANIGFGQTVKIQNVGSGGWLLLKRVDTTNSLDYTLDYETIGRQNGTIQLSDRLFRPLPFGYDSNSFDIKLYDFIPIFELRIILYAIKNNIFVNDLLNQFNKLFFASIRYILSEQNNVDWLFKTSFIKAKHNVGSLRKDITFNNDNLPSYEEYIEEVKPYKSKIREYVSNYDRLEKARSMISDFDLGVVYDEETNAIVVPKTKFVNNSVEVDNRFVSAYPNKNWIDNCSFEVISVKIVDPGSGYRTPPIVNLFSETGSGAEIKTYIGTNGKLKKCEIINPGSGYLSVPDVQLISNLTDEGYPAKISIEIGNSKVRSLKSKIKFDRTSSNYVVTQLSVVENFVASGSNLVYDLNWPMDLTLTNIKVFADNIELLSSEYSYENVEDTSKGYTRLLGQITTTTPIDTNVDVRVEYNKNIDMLNAADRIGKVYTPITDGNGKELSQLMSGVDYGGVEVKGLEFDNIKGWDNDVWFNSAWDAYVNTNEDEIFNFDGSTTEITLSKPLENGVVYNVYLNNVRLDDTNYDGSTVVDNPNAIMESLVGDGVTQTLYLDEFRMPTASNFAEIKVSQGDTLIIRKTSSDGTFAPMPDSLDTKISGGELSYGNAQGILANDITIDGDNFVTPTTSGSVEEHVPGQVLDTLNIIVQQKTNNGSSVISSDIHYGDNITTEFAINGNLFTTNQIIVRNNGNIVDSDDYSVSFINSTVEFNTAPSTGEIIHISNFTPGGSDILASETFISDGSTINIITDVPYVENLQSIVSINGIAADHQILNDGKDFTIINFAEPIIEDATIQYSIFSPSETINYSQINVETFIADGNSISYPITSNSDGIDLAEWNTVVTVNDQVLDPGYYEEFTLQNNVYEYSLDNQQIDLGNVPGYQLEVFVEDKELIYNEEFTWIPEEGKITINETVFTVIAGEQLKVYLRHNAEYQFGNFNGDVFEVDNTTVTFSNVYAENDVIKIYSFDNFVHQGILRDRITVKSTTGIPVNSKEYKKLANIWNKKIQLSVEAYDAQYVWIAKNNQFLTPSVDYLLDSTKTFINLLTSVDVDDEFLVIHFAAGPRQQQFSWQQFKDILNRTTFSAITESQKYMLADDLNWYDKKLVLKSADLLPTPGVNDKPGVIWIDGERIEYFVRDGNVLSQLRRGTLGTGTPVLHSKNQQVLYINAEHTIPYKDEITTTMFTADGTSNEYELDFTPTDETEFEVFVAGTRLRKNAIDKYRFEYTDNEGNIVDSIAKDSPEGDEEVSAEFTVVNSNTLRLENTPPENVKILVIRKKGMLWYEEGKTLATSNTAPAIFLQNVFK